MGLIIAGQSLMGFSTHLTPENRNVEVDELSSRFSVPLATEFGIHESWIVEENEVIVHHREVVYNTKSCVFRNASAFWKIYQSIKY